MTFKYPSELLESVKRNWRRAFSHEYLPKLPSTRTIKALLEVAYHASFLTEEQRKLSFRIAYISSFGAKRASIPGWEGLRPYDIVTFEIPRPFTVSEILRLAPATDITQMLIAVTLSQENTRVSPELIIWGLIDCGKGWWHMIHGVKEYAYAPPNCLTISSMQPGRLLISRGLLPVCTLDDGNIIEPLTTALYKGPISDFFDPAIEELYETLSKDKILFKQKEKEGDLNFLKGEYTELIKRTLFQISENHHGGTLLFVPDYLNINDSRLTDRVTIKYPCNYEKAFDISKRVIALRRKYWDDHNSLWKRKSAIPVKDFQESWKMRGLLQDLEEMKSDAITFIASTSGIDGAVIITNKFRLLGFGAEVIALSPQLSEIKVSTDASGTGGNYLPIDNYGTRHRSAFRFCSSYEDSVAFIVSQDGGVKAVKRVAASVVMWAEIDVGSI